jgi:hypothetical protein
LGRVSSLDLSAREAFHSKDEIRRVYSPLAYSERENFSKSTAKGDGFSSQLKILKDRRIEYGKKQKQRRPEEKGLAVESALVIKDFGLTHLL